LKEREIKKLLMIDM